MTADRTHVCMHGCSTPSDYVAAKQSYPADQQVAWPLRTDDFFPYSDCPHCFWTGYFASRPTAKAYMRSATSYLQAARQLLVLADIRAPCRRNERTANTAAASTTAAAGDEAFARGSSSACYSPSDLDDLEAAVALAQHHDAITGTAKQAVANDYIFQISRGWAKAEKVVNDALLRLMFASSPPSSSLSSSSRSTGAPTRPPAAARRSRRTLQADAAYDSSADSAQLHTIGSSSYNASDVLAATAASLWQHHRPRYHIDDASVAPGGGAPAALGLQQCRLLNATACNVTVSASRSSAGFIVVAHNPLAWARTHWLRLPVDASGLPGVGYVITSGSTQQEVPAELVPVSGATARLQQAMQQGERCRLLLSTIGIIATSGLTQASCAASLHLSAANMPFTRPTAACPAYHYQQQQQQYRRPFCCHHLPPGDTYSSMPLAFGTHELLFPIDLPPLGQATYFVRTVTGVAKAAAASAAASQPAAATAVARGASSSTASSPAADSAAAATAAAAGSNDNGLVVLSNGRLNLTFDSSCGQFLSLGAADGSWKAALKLDLMWCVRQSAHRVVYYLLYSVEASVALEVP